MKKHTLLWLAVGAAVVLLATWSKPLIATIHFEQPVSKNISLAVYTDNSYTSKIYDDASARLQVTVVKVRGGKRTTVWQKEYDAKLLKDYPTLQNALSQKVVVNNVVDSKEHLEVYYTVTYDDNGSKVQLQDGTVIAKGSNNGKLYINI
ncbi:MAG TPA: hypothetical protein VG738_03620 [Chitinophagaceae bacterium]|nr:hypothetical protein [Chitinophagaceae bacterium]